MLALQIIFICKTMKLMELGPTIGLQLPVHLRQCTGRQCRRLTSTVLAMMICSWRRTEKRTRWPSSLSIFPISRINCRRSWALTFPHSLIRSQPRRPKHIKAPNTGNRLALVCVTNWLPLLRICIKCNSELIFFGIPSRKGCSINSVQLTPRHTLSLCAVSVPPKNPKAFIFISWEIEKMHPPFFSFLNSLARGLFTP
jgi:hypothetical protein